MDFGKGIKAIIGFNKPLKNPDGENYNTSMVLKEIKKDIKNLKKSIGSFQKGLSYSIEGFTAEGLLKAFKKIFNKVSIFYQGGENEPDFLIWSWKKNKKYIFIVEVKNSINNENSLKNVIKQVEKYKEEYGAYKAIIGASKFPPELRKKALKKGIWVVIPSGKAFKLLRE